MSIVLHLGVSDVKLYKQALQCLNNATDDAGLKQQIASNIAVHLDPAISAHKAAGQHAGVIGATPEAASVISSHPIGGKEIPAASAQTPQGYQAPTERRQTRPLQPGELAGREVSSRDNPGDNAHTLKSLNVQSTGGDGNVSTGAGAGSAESKTAEAATEQTQQHDSAAGSVGRSDPAQHAAPG